MAEKLPRWIVRRGETYHFYRRVPARYEALVGAPFVRLSLETSDLGKAVVARDKLNALTEAHWRALARGDDPSERERYLAAVERARLEGFAYEGFDTLIETTVDSLLDRIAFLERAVQFGSDQPLSRDGRQARGAILGFEKAPGLKLSTLFEEYEKLTKDERLSKSEGQLHKWRLPHVRAISNLTEVIGDKAVAEFSRADANAFRAWWADRIEEDDLSPESANKDMSHLGKMIALVSDRLDLGLNRQFRGLRMASELKSRPPFSTKWIRERILAPGALAQLNDDARAVILVMIETGARPIEITHLGPKTIDVEGDLPHISIEPAQNYALKTPYSKRQIPLVGVALEGARILKASTNRYRDNTGSLSAAVNKFMSEQKPSLLETDDHSLYSFRHSFKDRLTAVSAPDIVDAALMGHKFDRPRYGHGPTLELKLEWILKIALTAEARKGPKST